jgi:hypothetical protein
MLLAWSTAVTTGLFTLLGAALGIALGGCVDFALESRREARLFRQAKRLIAEELFLVCMGLRHFVSSGLYPKSMGSGATAILPDGVWPEYRPIYATQANDKEFVLLSRLSVGVKFVREHMADGVPLSPAPPLLVQDAEKQLAIAAVAYKHLTGEAWDDFRTQPG